MRRLFLLAVALAVSTPALADTPSQTVRFFYSPVKYEPDPQFRARFTGPAKALFEQNDRAVEKNEGLGCIDFSPGIDGQDFDDALVAKTLKLSEKIDGDAATVTAKFDLFPGGDAKREMVWTLARDGDGWLISDLQSVTNKWRLSEFGCEEPQ